MKVHEYQAKSLLAKYGVPVPKGEVADTPEAAREAAERLRGPVVIKAQIHAGGRGKGGGSRAGKSPGGDQGREERRGGFLAGRRDPRDDSRHAPDRTGRAHRPKIAGRGGPGA